MVQTEFWFLLDQLLNNIDIEPKLILSHVILIPQIQVKDILWMNLYPRCVNMGLDSWVDPT